MLSKLDVLQRSVESLQYEKELQKDVEGKARQLDRLHSAVRLLAQTMLDDLRACHADVRAQHEVLRSFAEESSSEANHCKTLQQDLRKVGCHSACLRDEYFPACCTAARCWLSLLVMRVAQWVLAAY